MSDYTPITGEMLYEQILKVRLAKPSYGIPDPAPWSDLMFEAREAYEGVAAYLAEREQMVKAEAKTAERERIIALLESDRDDGSHNSEHWGHCICSGHLWEMLALIRGEVSK